MLWLILAHLIRAQPDSTTEATMDVILVTDTSTRADIEEAMAHVVATIQRMPSHWTDRCASLHAKLDAMLEDWERAEH